MEFLKQFMRRKAYKLVYNRMAVSGMFSDMPSVIFFGEIPFPTQEYMDIKNRME